MCICGSSEHIYIGTFPGPIHFLGKRTLSVLGQQIGGYYGYLQQSVYSRPTYYSLLKKY